MSHLADPVLGGQTEDVQVSSSGQWAYVADDTAALTSWSIGTSCALTPGSQSTGGTGREEYINLALATPTRLVTTDAGASTIDTYSLSPSGGIALLKSVAAQPGVTADGIEASPSTLFTGSLTGSAVDGVFFGDIGACSLGPTGASGCTTLVILSDPYGASNGLAIL